MKSGFSLWKWMAFIFAVYLNFVALIAWGFGNSSAFWKHHPPISPTAWTTMAAGGPGSYSGAAVWSGHYAIYWGGNTTNTGSTNAGGRYNPAANSWLSVNSTGNPSARKAMAYAWTGTRMAVWGGLSGSSSYHSDGALYDPETDTWTTLPSSGAAARGFMSGASNGTGDFFFFGGWAAGSSYYNDGHLYSQSSGTWTTATATGAPSTRKGHCVVATGSKYIVWGGTNGTFTNTGAIYDPVANTWTATSTTGAPVARGYHVCVWTGSKMIVWGGEAGSAGTTYNTGGIYDPVANTWTAMTTTNAPAVETDLLSAGWSGTKMYVFGGDNYSAAQATGGMYDPVANTWTSFNATNAPGARTYNLTVWTTYGYVVWGGTTSMSGASALATGAIYK